MPKSKSLHAILGIGGRVRKPRASRSSASAPLAASPNRTGLQQQAAHTGSPVKRGSSAAAAGRHIQGTEDDDDDDDELGQWDLQDEFDYFNDELDDNALVNALATDLLLRDVAQAMRIARARMFSPVPLRGLRSARIPALHARRATCPPLTTLAHLHALLASPSAAERELATLVRGGIVRRVAVTRMSEVEVLVLDKDLERLLGASEGVGEHARAEFGDWLRRNPGESVVSKGELNVKTADVLVREGFLTAKGYGGVVMAAGERERLKLRPNERASLVSLDRVARAASGSMAAVGGTGVVYEAGGGGPRSQGTADAFSTRNSNNANKRDAAADRTLHDLDLAVPGQGTFLRLATAAVEHLVSLIRNRSKLAQAPESTLREWWDCATPAASKSDEAAMRRRKRKRAAGGGGGGGGGGWAMGVTGSVGVVMPDRTTKWRLLDGVSFEWALEEAVGMGVVEMFDAGSVGKGVRVVV